MIDYFGGGSIGFDEIIRYSLLGWAGFSTFALLVTYLIAAMVTRSAMWVIGIGTGFCILMVMLGVLPPFIALYCVMINIFGGMAVVNFSRMAS